ncbi:MAG: 16S rRNA (cytidine(1402)-2'-O)-methyltransferase [candidate division Zixibacteria bacterium]|nr:16S rRNA (cytidine(1402)-2'-O)-methyltransferase [candidate division Zixibacteria bacterium]
MVESGVLYVVSTPIGNLEDITLRALRVLKEVDLVAVEDTRRTGLLLKHYGIKNRLESYHDFNKERKAPALIEELKSGKSVAVTSDAGTPGISDPCYLLVKLAVQEKIKVVPIPGASAFLSALVVSGLPTDRFAFEGFLPVKSGKRRKRLEELHEEKRTLIFFESPHRLLKTLEGISEILGERKMVVARELTKKFEEIKRGTPEEIKKYFQKSKIKGELVLVIEGAK